jgi:hypothetical protein
VIHPSTLEGSWKHTGRRNLSRQLASFQPSNLPRNESVRRVLMCFSPGTRPLICEGSRCCWKVGRPEASQSLKGFPPSRCLPDALQPWKVRPLTPAWAAFLSGDTTHRASGAAQGGRQGQWSTKARTSRRCPPPQPPPSGPPNDSTDWPRHCCQSC